MDFWKSVADDDFQGTPQIVPSDLTLDCRADGSVADSGNPEPKSGQGAVRNNPARFGFLEKESIPDFIPTKGRRPPSFLFFPNHRNGLGSRIAKNSKWKFRTDR